MHDRSEMVRLCVRCCVHFCVLASWKFRTCMTGAKLRVCVCVCLRTCAFVLVEKKRYAPKQQHSACACMRVRAHARVHMRALLVIFVCSQVFLPVHVNKRDTAAIV